MTGDQLKAMVSMTLRTPQDAARGLIRWNPPAQARWIGLLLVVVITLIVMRLNLLVVPVDTPSQLELTLRDPVTGFAIQTAVILFTTVVMTLGGRAFGGGGRFADALLLMVWLEFIFAIFGLLQFVLLLVLPLAGALFSMVSVALVVWLMVQFAAALHGFGNIWAVLLGLIGTVLLTAILTALVLATLGIDPESLMS